ncbi:hypothetical protein EVAR_14597_1 [Eumeta japonica]|uniref:Uncharacterized protein n=1 Tax=Eumeta variegata TaxID=151549 RepID=A0A4C1UUV2_EUMVA|nr:hypothetical protein EVAR_14597_1 [Eumeta japonica]
MDTDDHRGVTSALPASREGILYPIERASDHESWISTGTDGLTYCLEYRASGLTKVKRPAGQFARGQDQNPVPPSLKATFIYTDPSPVA